MAHEGLTTFTKLCHSLDDKVKIDKAYAEVTNELLKVFEAQELQLWAELATSQSSSKIASRELKARVVKKKKILTKRWEYISKLKAWLGKTKALDLLHAAKERAIAATAQAIQDYRKSKNFL